MTYDDIPDVQEILSDWSHGPRVKVYPSDVHDDCVRWLKEMDARPSHYPVTADSDFVECLVSHQRGSGNPLGYIRYTVWGGNHPLAPLPLSSLTLNIFAIHPAFRGQGFQTVLMNELVAACFDHTQPDTVYGKSANAAMSSRFDSRTYTERRTTQNAYGKDRDLVILQRSDYLNHIASGAATPVTTTLRVIPRT